MRAKRLVRQRGYGHRLVLTVWSLSVLRDHLPAVPAPREEGGNGISWRPVLFGLGAAVGFAVALGRARKVEAPGTVAAANPVPAGGSRVDGPLGRSIHLPAPLKESIEAELTPDGPMLFSPPDAIDPVGTEALESHDEADDLAKKDDA